MSAKIVQLKQPRKPPTASHLVEICRKISKESTQSIFWSLHAKDRMTSRGKSVRDVLETLKHGECVSGPKLDEFGDYRIKLRRCVAGIRTHVVIAVRSDDISIVTVT